MWTLPGQVARGTYSGARLAGCYVGIAVDLLGNRGPLRAPPSGSSLRLPALAGPGGGAGRPLGAAQPAREAG